MSRQNVIDIVLAKYEKYPIALTGCKTTTRALECCEYDFVVIRDEPSNELMLVDGDYAEIHNMPAKFDKLMMALYLHNLKIINDPSWVLSSLKQQADQTVVKALAWYARAKIVDALFYANRSSETVKENALIPSLWLKCAAYYYLEAAIALGGARPMPTHMLTQLRTAEERTVTEGIALATSCLGLERANKSSVSRAIEACIGLNDNLKHDYTTEVVKKKTRFLYDSSMYSDCYLYLGYVAREAVIAIAPNHKALKDYTFMISLAMDLTNDQSVTLKLAHELMDKCNELLKK